MGVSGSKIEEDKALLLCRERKRFVRQALDGRCSLAAAHVSYIQSLRNSGTALRKFVEPEAPSESSLYTSTSVTHEPLALTDKSISQFSYSSPHSHRVEPAEQFSPTPSPPSSGRFHVNYMKAGRSAATTIEERPPTPVTATLHQQSTTPKHTVSQLDENSSEPPLPSPGTPPWDYFDFFHPVDSQFSYQDGRSMNLELDDDIRRLREEEGIPELEEEGENAPTNGGDDFVDSEDDFDQPSDVNLVRMFKNRNEVLNTHSTNGSLAINPVEVIPSETNQQNDEKPGFTNGAYETDETPEMTPSKSTPSAVTLPNNVQEKGFGSDRKLSVKDFKSCMKEIEDLFIRAAESGTEVPRMLEANKVNFRPLFPEEIANKSKASMFLASCFSCCTEEAQLSQTPVSNEIKYLTWHRSASSLSSSSRIPLATTLKEDSEDLNNSVFGSIYMNSGSHASTLDRLYAWERKLYDEVKASGVIRREYDMKCRLLRQEESKGESHYKIDKTRAAVKDLHVRIRVAIHRIDSISKIIEELRDKELQPQLEELIGGLIRMWVMMLDCHKHQYSIVSVACNNGNTMLSIRSEESHRQATVRLEFELNSLCSGFTKWISSHKSYLQAINGWLHKCVFPLRHKSSRRRKVEEFDPKRDRAPPIFVTCRDWLVLLDDLPAKDVEDAIKDLVAVTTHFLPRQEKTHGNSKLSFSLPRKAVGGSELKEDLLRNEAPVNWSLNFDSLQSALVVFLDRLQTFAEKSVEKYGALQQAINAAKDAYARD